MRARRRHGSGAGRGHSVNLALPEDVTDAGWLRGLDAVVEPVLREVRPFALVTQHGCDTHAADPLGGLAISVEAQREAAASRRLVQSLEGRLRDADARALAPQRR